MKKRSHEFKTKRISIKIVKTREGRSCFHQFENIFRAVQEAKSLYSEAPSNSHSNAFKINEFEDPYKEIWKEHWTLRVLKFVGINFGRMKTRWKGKFMHFAMEQCFSTCSVLEIERKIREDAAAMRKIRGSVVVKKCVLQSRR